MAVKDNSKRVIVGILIKPNSKVTKTELKIFTESKRALKLVHNGQIIGLSTVRLTNEAKDLVASVSIDKEDYYDYKHLYPVLKKAVAKNKELLGALYLSLEEDNPLKDLSTYIMTLEDQVSYNRDLNTLNRMIAEKRRLRWSDKRINKWLFKKHNIVIK